MAISFIDVYLDNKFSLVGSVLRVEDSNRLAGHQEEDDAWVIDSASNPGSLIEGTKCYSKFKNYTLNVYEQFSNNVNSFIVATA